MTHSYRYRLLTLALACAAVAACSQDPAPAEAVAASAVAAAGAARIDGSALAALDPKTPLKTASGATVAVKHDGLGPMSVTYSGMPATECAALVKELVATGEFVVMDSSLPMKGALVINGGLTPAAEPCNRASNTVTVLGRQPAPPACLFDAAGEFKVPRDVLEAILKAELPASSPAIAGLEFGPLGLSPRTIDYVEKNARISGARTDTCQNLRAGAWLLADMIAREKGDLWKGVERYYGNAKMAANVRAMVESAQ